MPQWVNRSNGWLTGMNVGAGVGVADALAEPFGGISQPAIRSAATIAPSPALTTWRRANGSKVPIALESTPGEHPVARVLRAARVAGRGHAAAVRRRQAGAGSLDPRGCPAHRTPPRRSPAPLAALTAR